MVLYFIVNNPHLGLIQVNHKLGESRSLSTFAVSGAKVMEIDE
jgi:hypothetical protein